MSKRRRPQPPVNEPRTINVLNRVIESAINTQPPTKGIESSADRLGAALDSLHAGTLVYMESGARQIGEKFHLQTSDVLNFLWAKLRVKT